MPRVAAAPGLKCPMETKPREYITDDLKKAVTVPDTSYYRRLLADGSLVEVHEKPKGGSDQ